MRRNERPTTIAYLDDGHPESRDCTDNYVSVANAPHHRRLPEHLERLLKAAAAAKPNADKPAS